LVFISYFSGTKKYDWTPDRVKTIQTLLDSRTQKKIILEKMMITPSQYAKGRKLAIKQSALLNVPNKQEGRLTHKNFY